MIFWTATRARAVTRGPCCGLEYGMGSPVAGWLAGLPGGLDRRPCIPSLHRALPVTL